HSLQGVRYFSMGLTTLIVPNVIFFIVARWLEVGRPWLNLDYALAILLFAFNWRFAGAVLAAFFLMIEALSLGGQVLPFVRVVDVLYLLQFIGSASLHYLILLSVGCVFLVSLWWLLIVSGRRVPRLVALV